MRNIITRIIVTHYGVNQEKRSEASSELKRIEQVKRLIYAAHCFHVQPRNNAIAKRERRQGIENPHAVFSETRQHITRYHQLRAVTDALGFKAEAADADCVA